MKIALLGAESSGKTQLALNLAAHCQAAGRTAHVVAEYLREWCDRKGRTPRPDEQEAIACEQARRVDSAPACDVLISDTTPLMVAIYSELLFDDRSLYGFAGAHQSSYDLTLVMGLDLPWVADGHQRDGPHVREPVDALLRRALYGSATVYGVVYGWQDERLTHALSAIDFVALRN